MSSEAKEPQEQDDESAEVDDQGDGRMEARARDPEGVEEKSEVDEETPSDKPVVPAPSESTDGEADENDEAEQPGLAEETSDVEDEGLAEDTSEVEEETLAEDSSEAAGEETSEAESAEPESRFTDLDEQAEEWLADLFARMNFDADAALRWEEDRPHVDISGPDANHLLGRGKLGPKAVEGIETLLQSVFSQDDAASDVYVDVDGKRAARKEMLQEVADSMADKAVDLGEKLTVSGLNSTERRIIHRRLRDYDGVDTESVGDGIFRRLTIEPT